MRLLEVFYNKDVVKNFEKFTGKHLCQSLFFNKVADLRLVTLLKKETRAQVFSCEFFTIFKNTFIEQPRWQNEFSSDDKKKYYRNSKVLVHCFLPGLEKTIDIIKLSF